MKMIHGCNADTGEKIDFARKSDGASIVRFSHPYQLKACQAMFGIMLWCTKQYNFPSVILESGGAIPGEAWAFSGSRGYVVVELSRHIYVNEIIVEHIPRMLAPTGRLDSALKNLEVWGLKSEMDLVGVPLGNFTYDDVGTPLQSFCLKNDGASSFKFIQMTIKSDYGEESYTTLYRLRVLGDLNPRLV